MRYQPRMHDSQSRTFHAYCSVVHGSGSHDSGVVARSWALYPLPPPTDNAGVPHPGPGAGPVTDAGVGYTPTVHRGSRQGVQGGTGLGWMASAGSRLTPALAIALDWNTVPRCRRTQARLRFAGALSGASGAGAQLAQDAARWASRASGRTLARSLAAHGPAASGSGVGSESRRAQRRARAMPNVPKSVASRSIGKLECVPPLSLPLSRPWSLEGPKLPHPRRRAVAFQCPSAPRLVYPRARDPSSQQPLNNAANSRARARVPVTSVACPSGPWPPRTRAPAILAHVDKWSQRARYGAGRLAG